MEETEIRNGLREVLNSLLGGSFLGRELVGKLSVLVTEAREIGTGDETILRYLEKIRGVVVTRTIFVCYADRSRKRLFLLSKWMEEQIRIMVPYEKGFAN